MILMVYLPDQLQDVEVRRKCNSLHQCVMMLATPSQGVTEQQNGLFSMLVQSARENSPEGLPGGTDLGVLHRRKKGRGICLHGFTLSPFAHCQALFPVELPLLHFQLPYLALSWLCKRRGLMLCRVVLHSITMVKWIWQQVGC